MSNRQLDHVKARLDVVEENLYQAKRACKAVSSILEDLRAPNLGGEVVLTTIQENTTDIADALHLMESALREFLMELK